MSDSLAALRTALAGHYEIQRELGQGAFATVYLAHDRRHDRAVALKVLNVDPSTDLGELRFQREIRILAGLQHPHILPLHDSGHVLNVLYYVTPYIRGDTLRDRMDRERQLAVPEAVRLAREVADALECAHREGIIHRDIKPENILLSGGHAVVADFGIARVIGDARARQITKTGLGPGTPAYMSPEQMLGEREVDARSDIYSLGCVLYEMLAGTAPFAGPAGLARRFTEPPPSVLRARAGVPEHVDLAIRAALACDPAERPATAKLFAQSLGGAPHAPPADGAAPGVVHPAPAPARIVPDPPVSPPRWRRAARRVWPLLPLLVLFVTLTPVIRGPLGSADVASASFVVLPFSESDLPSDPMVSGREAAILLHESLSRWHDLDLVSPLRVNDARLRRGGRAFTLREALTTAEALGAGVLVWGDVSMVQRTPMLRAVLYDVAARTPIRELVVRLTSGSGDVRARFDELADSLLTGGSRAPGAPGGGGTRILAARKAYDSGWAALDQWDLAGAERRFREAALLDPQYPLANLWLAQVMSWTSGGARAPAEWARAARTAAAAVPPLPPRDAELARALVDLAESRFPQACERFATLVAADSQDFAAWYGLGECQRLDRVVVPDASSPSGWRFRASYHTAMDAYGRALALVPSMHLAFRGLALARLERLLFTEVNTFREGVSAAADSQRFAAFPSVDADTLAFVPHPINAVRAGDPAAIPASQSDAVARNRRMLRRIASGWTEAFPESADAHEALARALEATGEIASERADAPSALASTRRARSFATGAAQRLRLSRAEARLLLKQGEFAAAQRLADSLLSANLTPTLAEAQELSGLAALTGRLARAAELMLVQAPEHRVRMPDGRPYDPPDDLSREVLPLMAYAALGASADSVRGAVARIDRLLRAHAAPARRAELRTALLERPMSLAFPVSGPQAVRGLERSVSPLLSMQRALARGDSGMVRRRLAELRRLRGSRVPGSLSADAIHQEAWLALAIGDTAAAANALDEPLAAPSALSATLLDGVAEPAALVRAMALRAQLARRAGDGATAEHWARAVTTLWVDADPELQGLVGEMREILGG